MSDVEKVMDYPGLVENSPKFQKLKKTLRVATKLSLSGITNFVVNYEDPYLIDCFLKNCWNEREVYLASYDIDAVDLQDGAPGSGRACAYLDNLIFGSAEPDPSSDPSFGGPMSQKDKSGNTIRKPNGFVNRPAVLTGRSEDNLLIIKNLDYSLDFCQGKPGEVDPRALWIFDKFRNPNTKISTSILLITNEPVKLPFKVRRVVLDPVDEMEATAIIEIYISLYEKHKYEVVFSNAQRQQMIRKLTSLTYAEAGDIMGEAISNNSKIEGSRKIDSLKVLKTLRESVNKRFMENAHGISHLSPRPWEDYITPESSNFTFDVKKIMRDFREVERLQVEQSTLNDIGQDDSLIQGSIDAVCSRMPHVMVLYGRGGTGKSAFPIHFAGLLGFDVWDFNINASHSKWIGEGSERMREALEMISKASHVVVRIDEYDRAMGSTSAAGAGMHEAHKQVESEFMNWLQNAQEDNLFVKNNIFVVMTTNHKENITGPMLRSGRADLVIDIADFDAKSLKETFLSAPRRMAHRDVKCIDMTTDQLIDAVGRLDLDKISELAAMRGFTVRDVDCVLQEMAAHDYYRRMGDFGLEWNNENFLKVMENSQGSAKTEETCELKIGDREIFESTEDTEYDPQGTFDFFDESKEVVTFDVNTLRGFE